MKDLKLIFKGNKMATDEEKKQKNKDLSDKIKLYAEAEGKKGFTSTVIIDGDYYTTIETKDEDGYGVSTLIKKAQ